MVMAANGSSECDVEKKFNPNISKDSGLNTNHINGDALTDQLLKC